MATKPLDDDALAAIVDADRDSMSDDDLTLDARAHCAHSLRLGEALQQERAAHARTRAELAAVRERLGMAADVCRAVYMEHRLSREYPMDMGGLALECAERVAALAAARKETP